MLDSRYFCCTVASQDNWKYYIHSRKLLVTWSYLKISAKMASGHSRRSTRRSLVMGERMGPPKLFETKRDSVMPSRPSQFGKSGPSRPSVGLPSFGGPPKRNSILNTNQSIHSARGYVVYAWGLLNILCVLRSSICGGPTIKKDPRPLSDKCMIHVNN